MSRLKGLESAGGFKVINLFYVDLGENAYEVEQEVHHTLSGFRQRTSFNTRSEWFMVRFTWALAVVLQQVYKVGLWVFPPDDLSLTIENKKQRPVSNGRGEKYFAGDTGFVQIRHIEMVGHSETVELQHAIVAAIRK